MYFSASAMLPDAMPLSCARVIVWCGVWLRKAVVTTSCRLNVLSRNTREVSASAPPAAKERAAENHIKTNSTACRLLIIMLLIPVV